MQKMWVCIQRLPKGGQSEANIETSEWNGDDDVPCLDEHIHYFLSSIVELVDLSHIIDYRAKASRKRRNLIKKAWGSIATPGSNKNPRLIPLASTPNRLPPTWVRRGGQTDRAAHQLCAGAGSPPPAPGWQCAMKQAGIG